MYSKKDEMVCENFCSNYLLISHLKQIINKISVIVRLVINELAQDFIILDLKINVIFYI
jgi:hypothetical protein